MLISIALFLVGAVAYRFLPVAPLPQVDMPTVFVQASLAGASPETMAATVAMPLERAMGQIAGITEMTSRSSQGSSHVIIQFDLSRNIDGAARDVMAAINAARTLLPSAMKTLPTYRKANPSDMPIVMLALTSETLSRGELYDLASSRLQQKIAQVKGVGQVSVRGGALPAVRIELDPQELANMGLGIDEVRSAVEATTTNSPVGLLDGGGKLSWISVNGQLTKASEFRDLIVAWKEGRAVRLSDIASVTDSVQNIYSSGYFNNVPSVSLSVTRQTDANMLETIEGVKNLLPVLNEMLPAGTKLTLAIDRSLTIQQALVDMEEALIVAVLLVIVVVYLFLKRGKTVLIPAIALPISIVATFAAMYLLGFSLNTLSMMALIISTGFVVDDAIVVLENIERHIEEGMTPREAALFGSREIGFTVLSMTLSLIAVFIPLFLMEGVVGRYFVEFAVTLSSALIASMFVSLTLTPMLCSRMLKARSGPDAPKENLIIRLFTAFFSRLQAAYMRSLRVCLRHRFLTLVSLFLTIAANFYCYGIIDKGLFPDQDSGQLMGMMRLDLTSSFQTTNERLQVVSRRIQADPDVRFVLSSTGDGGFGSRNTGNFFIQLRSLEEGRRDAATIVANRLTRTAGEGLPGTEVFLMATQDLRVGGRSANATYQYSLQCEDLDLLNLWTPRVYATLKMLPELTSVDSDAESTGVEVNVVIDREAASRLGLDVRDIDDFLNNAFSQRQIATRYEMLNQYYSIITLNAKYTEDPNVLNDLFMLTASGERVPLSDFTRLEFSAAPLSVSHQNQMATSTIAFNLNDGVSLERAKEAIDRAVVEIGLPGSIYPSLQGTAKTFDKVMRQIPLLIGAAIVTIYILLGILYESWIHPVTILSTLPSAGIGALLLMMATGTQFTVIAMIGILLLIGIVKKNAILMIDFAITAEKEGGLKPVEAIAAACEKRFRPILMTTLCAFFGAVPLIVQSGSNASMNRPLGIAICGGLAVSQVLTLYTTPVVYVYLDQFGSRVKRLWRKSPLNPTPCRNA